MEFFLTLSPDQINIITKGLQNLQSAAGNTEAYIMGQIQAQQVAREIKAPEAAKPKIEAPKAEEPKADEPKEEVKDAAPVEEVGVKV